MWTTQTKKRVQLSSYHASHVRRFRRACPGRSEQLVGYKTQERILFSPTVGLVPDGGHDSLLKHRATDRDKPDGEQFLMKSSCSHPIVDPDRGKPDGNLGRKRCVVR